MSYGRSRLYSNGDVAEQGDVAAAAVAAPEPQGRKDLGLTANPSIRGRLSEIEQEVDALRSINAHLIRQVAILKAREAQAQRLADRDGLTGLYNRRRMLELLEGSIADASRREHRVGLLFIDLDGFKAINDDHGHATGDKILVTVASRLAGRARTGDSVCRYGGDEFVVILPRVADYDALMKVAHSIGKRVALPYRMAGRELKISAAIGVSIFPDLAAGADALMRSADESMYREKSRWNGGLSGRARTPARRRDDRAKSAR